VIVQTARADRTAPAPPWAARRERAGVLRERYPFAREPLSLYLALVDVQQAAWCGAKDELLRPSDFCAYVVSRVLPDVIEATVTAGPRALADLVRRLGGASPAGRADLVRRWLDGEEQTPAERYLARACASPVLEALGGRAGDAFGGVRPSEDGDRRCRVCGGLPQCAFIAAPVESLASGPRSLMCSRCAAAWPYPRLTCAACGEHDTAKLTVLSEEGTDERALSGSAVRGLRGRPGSSDPSRALPRFPHVRIDACTTCSRYLLSIDLGRDARAVPIVDEMAAIPLDLYAVERGFTKVAPNLMGA
jgi:formate dehydrogenase maturation protein FdhE